MAAPRAVRRRALARSITATTMAALMVMSAHAVMTTQNPDQSLVEAAETAHSRWFFFSVAFAVVFGVAGAWLSYMVWSSGNRVQDAVRRDIALANERAASANATAESERLARLKLEARLADRVLTSEQLSALSVKFAALKGETVDIGVFGNNLDISNVANVVMACLKNAGAEFNFFSPLGGVGGVRGVIIGVRTDASSAIKEAAASFVTILGETLGEGVAAVEFTALDFKGATSSGKTDKAAQQGTGPVRIWIGAK